MSKYILITGGLGYIGTHLAFSLIERGYMPIIVDNLSNSYVETLNNLNILCNEKLIFKELDITDYSMLEHVASIYKIDSIIHLAAKKSISESIKNPSLYKHNNVIGTKNILKLMSEFSINNLVFSSSACVYDPSNNCPIKESAKIKCTHPYGNTKIESEDLIKDFCTLNNNYKFSILRYFNPVGAHESGFIGEDPRNKQGNLFPNILDVIFKKKKNLTIFGNDYNTHDGTPIRDYIHIMDLVGGHLSSLEFLRQKKSHILNLGTARIYCFRSGKIF